MTLIQKLLNWLFRRKKQVVIHPNDPTEYHGIPLEAEKPKVTPRVVPVTPVSRHIAGGKVDPALFKDAKLSKPEIPHDDPASPFYPYWLEAQISNGLMPEPVADIPLMEPAPVSEPPAPHHHHHQENHHAEDFTDRDSYRHHDGNSGADTWGTHHSGTDSFDSSPSHSHHHSDW